MGKFLPTFPVLQSWILRIFKSINSLKTCFKHQIQQIFPGGGPLNPLLLGAGVFYTPTPPLGGAKALLRKKKLNPALNRTHNFEWGLWVKCVKLCTITCAEGLTEYAGPHKNSRELTLKCNFRGIARSFTDKGRVSTPMFGRISTRWCIWILSTYPISNCSNLFILVF